MPFRRAAALFLWLIILLPCGPAAGRASEAAAGGAPPPLVRIRPLMVPSVHLGHVEKYLSYEVILELRDGDAQAKAQALLPRLHDAVMAAFYDGIAQGWVVRGAVINATALRQRIDAACEAFLDKGAVTRVLISPTARAGTGPP